jgi:L-asparaginase
MRRVAVVFTGGTISMKPDAAAGGALPVLRGAEIIERTPGLADVAEVVPIDWGLVPASHLDFAQMLDICSIVERELERDDVDGAVVVQGTDTIEETAFAWDLLIRSDKPVVVTGAMRNAAELHYDGPQNLRDAVLCAASPALRGMGTMVVLGGSVVDAATAVKTHTTALDTFKPRDGSPIGTVRADGMEVDSPRGARPRLPVVPRLANETVHLVTAVTGMDGTLIRLLRSERPAGLVVAATGAGNTHPDVLAAAQELMAYGTVVVLTTRCAHGVVSPAYAFPGGGATWQRAGTVLSPLSGPKCRVALTLGLAAGLTDAALRWILRA